MKYGNLNFLEPSGPLQAPNGTGLPLPLLSTIIFSTSNLKEDPPTQTVLSATNTASFYFQCFWDIYNIIINTNRCVNYIDISWDGHPLRSRAVGRIAMQLINNIFLSS